ncbi:bacteriohemerythrin [Acidaminobacter sp. JC074]|uniref:bacteriohemerythrin n=1 Tax=Acidaminobacter sp. JC074 TaxID=2530199 RepID=UPI001F0D92EF|nr:bacteriohemerythrin [Acidaminobacter sp. JC074]MCH4888294.1 bacteriohemerythrin [Acidaminobacter sp. JC074]
MFDWKEDYSVGVKEIDAQHKRLFEMGQAMSDLVSNHGDEDIYDELTAMFNELIDYTRYHFNDEEKLMEKVNYKDLEDHKVQHQLFVEKLEAYDLETIDEDQGAFALKLLKTVATWIFKHITGDDFRYREAMTALS